MDEKQLRDALKEARRALKRAERLVQDEHPPGSSGLGNAAQALYNERKRRNALFPSGLFVEPEWDMLLFLFSATSSGRLVRQIDLLSAANVPHTTGLRVIQRLEKAGLVEQAHASAKRRVIRLTKAGAETMERFLAECDARG